MNTNIVVSLDDLKGEYFSLFRTGVENAQAMGNVLSRIKDHFADKPIVEWEDYVEVELNLKRAQAYRLISVATLPSLPQQSSGIDFRIDDLAKIAGIVKKSKGTMSPADAAKAYEVKRAPKLAEQAEVEAGKRRDAAEVARCAAEDAENDARELAAKEAKEAARKAAQTDVQKCKEALAVLESIVVASPKFVEKFETQVKRLKKVNSDALTAKENLKLAAKAAAKAKSAEAIASSGKHAASIEQQERVAA